MDLKLIHILRGIRSTEAGLCVLFFTVCGVIVLHFPF